MENKRKMEFDCEVKVINAPRGSIFNDRQNNLSEIYINPSKIFDSNSYKRIVKTSSTISHHGNCLNFVKKAKEFSVFKLHDNGIAPERVIRKKSEDNTLSNTKTENEQHNEELILMISPKTTSNDGEDGGLNDDLVICLKIGDNLEIKQTHLNLDDVMHEHIHPIQNSPSCETIVESEE